MYMFLVPCIYPLHHTGTYSYVRQVSIYNTYLIMYLQ